MWGTQISDVGHPPLPGLKGAWRSNRSGRPKSANVRREGFGEPTQAKKRLEWATRPEDGLNGPPASAFAKVELLKYSYSYQCLSLFNCSALPDRAIIPSYDHEILDCLLPLPSVYFP
jgi:hypothetical protein